jgi:hypothetical protein
MTAGDAEELLKRAHAAEAQARECLAEARRLTQRASELDSLDALNELVRLSVADGNVDKAVWLLRNAVHCDPDLPAGRLVSVAPDIAGPAWARDPEGKYHWPGAGVFTVIAADPVRAAATLDRTRGKLMLVDEYGTVHANYDELEATIERYSAEGRWDLPYTPNFASDVKRCQYGVEVMLDTKGVMWQAMARALAEVIAQALREDGVAGHITGWRPEISRLMTVWNPGGARD